MAPCSEKSPQARAAEVLLEIVIKLLEIIAAADSEELQVKLLSMNHSSPDKTRKKRI